ncbi:hypothetical protein C4565_03690 [Candidatus Parcubacteria bacterium]|nr:MAG: hypothetical protein C4565_03690 [Candidatus Parcubacteria bacterium]
MTREEAEQIKKRAEKATINASCKGRDNFIEQYNLILKIPALADAYIEAVARVKELEGIAKHMIQCCECPSCINKYGECAPYTKARALVEAGKKGKDNAGTEM